MTIPRLLALRLRNDADGPELREVLIEGKCLGQLEPIDEGLARAVGEAPSLVGEVPKDLPGSAHVVLSQAVDRRDASREERLSETQSSRHQAAGLEESKRLIDDVVRGQQGFSV